MVWTLPQVCSAEIDPETGCWRVGSLMKAAGKTTKDASGKGHDGTINGAKWKNGKIGKGLEFDGCTVGVHRLNP